MLDDGYVGVSVSADEGATGENSFVLDDGPGSVYTAAEEKCQKEVPAYQRAPLDNGSVAEAERLDQSRAFAGCARQNGLTDFPDPDVASGGKLVVPTGTTKAQFLAVVTACVSSFGAGSPVQPDGVMTIAVPEFGGAYDRSWSAEVMDIMFAAAPDTMAPSASPTAKP